MRVFPVICHYLSHNKAELKSGRFLKAADMLQKSRMRQTFPYFKHHLHYTQQSTDNLTVNIINSGGHRLFF